MLVLLRKVGEEIVIGREVVVRVARVSRNHVSLTIEAPANIRVDRKEVWLAKKRELCMAGRCEGVRTRAGAGDASAAPGEVKEECKGMVVGWSARNGILLYEPDGAARGECHSVTLPAVYVLVFSSVLCVRPVFAQGQGHFERWDNPSGGKPVNTMGNTIWEEQDAAFDGGQLPDVARLPQVVPSIGPQSWNRHEPGSPGEEFWTWQLLPDGVIYPAYLAGTKESRLASVWNHDAHLGWMWDLEAGGRVGLLRYGTEGSPRPDGWELDIEGAAFPRLDLDHDQDLISADFRFGIPLTFGCGPFQAKLAAYHLSSHLGDEFSLRFPGYPRINYSRDAIVLGGSYYVTDALRLYAEAEWAWYTDGGTKPWQFQFGIDYSPLWSSQACRGAPFLALNGQLREEVDYGGQFVVQAGWQWRGGSNHLARAGVQYFTGKSEQFQFFRRNEEKVGLAMWYDY